VDSIGLAFRLNKAKGEGRISIIIYAGFKGHYRQVKTVLVVLYSFDSVEADMLYKDIGTNEEVGYRGRRRR
jgi:hypothetical protein